MAQNINIVENNFFFIISFREKMVNRIVAIRKDGNIEEQVRITLLIDWVKKNKDTFTFESYLRAKATFFDSRIDLVDFEHK